MRNITVIFFISLFIISCKSGKITTTETKPTETIVFGKLTINSEKEINYKDIWIHFNERLSANNIARLDENGYFFAKLPVGHNNIAMLIYGKKNKNIPKDYVSIDVADNNTVYYIGDVFIDWKPSNKDRGAILASAFGGVAGALISANTNGEQLPVKITTTDSTIEYFKEQYPNNQKKIKTELIKIDFSHKQKTKEKAKYENTTDFIY